MSNDYSKLFSSGLRAMAQRRQRLSSLIISTISQSSPQRDDVTSPVIAAARAVLPSKFHRKGSGAHGVTTSGKEFASEAKSSNGPKFVADDVFNTRIWDGSSSSSSVSDEDDEVVDPFGVGRKSVPLEPVSPLEKPFRLALSPSADMSFLDFAMTPVEPSPSPWTSERRGSARMSLASRALRPRPHAMQGEDDVLEEEDLSEAWQQFRVEWISLD
ncbi:hypothetical protein FA95DRAFT_1603524 [Auriscalpium vulgare]|uniref:Uncharacterized protein n=1 Tax=Auriscalpium vulgare TaxID=40419 RepID=A0ACB8S336_9AGAM|nr:hypothetical protein FA95DRAFT_1603524 [Auriscalpium vulgare]